MPWHLKTTPCYQNSISVLKFEWQKRLYTWHGRNAAAGSPFIAPSMALYRCKEVLAAQARALQYFQVPQQWESSLLRFSASWMEYSNTRDATAITWCQSPTKVPYHNNFNRKSNIKSFFHPLTQVNYKKKPQNQHYLCQFLFLNLFKIFRP